MSDLHCHAQNPQASCVADNDGDGKGRGHCQRQMSGLESATVLPSSRFPLIHCKHIDSPALCFFFTVSPCRKHYTDNPVCKRIMFSLRNRNSYAKVNMVYPGLEPSFCVQN